MSFYQFLQWVVCLAGLFILTGCGTTPDISQSNNPLVRVRNAAIAHEATGNHYVGRRYFVHATRFWGYVRKPRQSWDKAKLVVMNESFQHTPDRLPEGGRPGHGFDHNYEYKLWGQFSKDKIYDPASNRTYPEFVLKRYELINKDPGFLFHPNEGYDPKRLPPRERGRTY